MLTISRDLLEKNIQKYFDHIHQTGEDVIITDNDIPILKLSSFKPKTDVEGLFKDVRGRVKYYDDIMKPETAEWGDV